MTNRNDDTPEAAGRPAGAVPAPAAASVLRGNPRARRRGLLLLATAVGVGLLAYGAGWLLFAGASETTDDAYVNGDLVAITARDAGTVLALHADDTERVQAGQPLVDLDPAIADAELEAAAAALGQAVRAVRADFSQVDAARAERSEAHTVLMRARADLARREQAAAQGAVSGEEFAHALETVKTADAGLERAASRLAQAEAQVHGTDLRRNPAVLAAIAGYRRAAIRRSHMHVVAPVAGTIAKRSVQIGQQIGAGTPLMVVVPLDRLWIDANFRETQLADLRLGQPVRITTDTYGGGVVFHGEVIGLGAGSGNAFALLPPQNATGNWIKIVQRVPVRIGLDPRELIEHPLRIGLSALVEVDTSSRSGSPLGREARSPYPTQPSLSPDVEAEIERIISANASEKR
ncbi:hemolysin D [Steroidobacter denitrificans]|uniref:Hemolysin D n=1 Tax=Steroidobacter denitrificans TaxID=465721 RepID=A0A127FBZ9_STEDE|nr:efflux RND transporter periplasmic adaptor subunit [Steroidobacter denitrificans]AMN47944.1 hemolysin D [Steroidobacter denitrificans]